MSPRYEYLADSPPLPLLITGVAGVAGYNAFQYFHRRFPGQVVGTRRPNDPRLVGPGIVSCDSFDPQQLRRLFDEYRFQSVLNAAGSCKLKSCECDPVLAHRLNVLGIKNLLHWAGSRQLRLVHLSIDLVYSGLGDGNHSETDPVDPVTVYGQTMAHAEQLVSSHYPEACILRISLPMGVSFNGHAGAIDWIQSRFQRDRPATLYYDEIRTPQYVDCLNHLCHRLLTNRLSGLFHAGGPRPLSLYQIAQIVNRVGGYDPRHLQGCFRIEAGPVPPRAGDVTLNSQRLADVLGYQPFDQWPYESVWVPSHRNWHWERPAAESGSADLLAKLLYRNPARS